MSNKFQIRESRRLPFYAPIEIQWTDSGRQHHSVRGTSHDVSIYGLGISVPRQLPFDQELTILVKGVEICGGAVVRHAQPCESGFRIGLYFRLTLLMQNVPGLDELLEQSRSSESGGTASVLISLVRRFTVRIWRSVLRKTGGSLSPAVSGGSSTAGTQPVNLR